jgi:retron-type reverse transcriptase
VSGDFKPKGLLAIAIEKPGKSDKRIICVPTIADRLIQLAILQYLRPRLARIGVDNSISYGVVRGPEKSVLGARKFACRSRQDKEWVYKTDIRKFFDNIPRPMLSDFLQKKIQQKTLLPVILPFVGAELTDGFDRSWESIARDNGIMKGRGIRQGMPFSPFFAGAFLRDLDYKIIKKDILAARYVDDFIAFFSSRAEAEDFHFWLHYELFQLGLDIGEPNAENSKTRIYEPGEPAEFLGLELSRDSKGRYRLNISDDVQSRVLQKLDNFSKLDYLLENGKSLTSMGGFFQNIARGYVNAYAEAENVGVFRERVNAKLADVQRQIVAELFGEARLAKLSKAQRAFIGVDAILAR